MKKLSLLSLMILLPVALLPAPAVAAAPVTQTAEPEAGSVLCPTGLYPQAPDDCLPLGPSGTLSSLADIGIPWPVRPLPAYKPDRALSDYPFHYFKVRETGTYDLAAPTPRRLGWSPASSCRTSDCLGGDLLPACHCCRVQPSREHCPGRRPTPRALHGRAAACTARRR